MQSTPTTTSNGCCYLENICLLLTFCHWNGHENEFGSAVGRESGAGNATGTSISVAPCLCPCSAAPPISRNVFSFYNQSINFLTYSHNGKVVDIIHFDHPKVHDCLYWIICSNKYLLYGTINKIYEICYFNVSQY